MRVYLTIIYLFLCGLTIAQGVSLEKVNGIGNSNTIYDLISDNRGHVWIATDAGLFKVEGKRPKTVLAGTPALALTKDNSNVYTALANRQILKNGKPLFKITEPSIRINSLELVGNKLWVGTEANGVYTYNLTNGNLTGHHTKKNSKLKSNRINFIHKDSDRKIWIGTNKGVARVDNDKWKLFDEQYKMLAMTESKDELWLLADEEMWQIHSNGKRWEPLSIRDGWSKGRVNEIIVDKEKKIYIASQILVRVDPFTDQIESFSDALGFLSQECLSLLADDNQNIWFGTKSSGLYVTEFGLESTELSAIQIIEQENDCDGRANASISLKISGGKAPFKLNWSDSKFSGMDLVDIKAGEYAVTITDAEGSSTIQDILISNSQPLSLEITNSQGVTKAGASNGTATLEVSGGVYPYTVRWDSNEKGMTARKLSAGIHNVTVTDKNGCKSETSFEIEKSKIIPDLDIATVSVGQTLRINQLYFAADSSNVSPQSFEVLEEIYNFLNANTNVVVEIGGHTNNIPSHEYCDKLSADRARSIASYLYEKGIPENRLTHKGYGKRNPISSNRTVEGRRKNQRVEMKILEIL